MTINAGGQQNDPIKQAQIEASRIQAMLSGMVSGLKAKDINELAAAFGNMTPSITATTAEIIAAAKNVDDIARTSLGVRNAEAINKAKANLMALNKAIDGHTSGIEKSFINMMRFQLEIEESKNNALMARQKSLIGGITGVWYEGQNKIMKGMEGIFGTQIAGMLTKFVGPILIFEGVMMALQFLFNSATAGIKSFGNSWASAGGMAARTGQEYIAMTSKIAQGLNDVTQVGYTTKEATDLVQKSMTAMSWTLGWSAIQSEHYTGSLSEQTVEAALKTQGLVLEMGRMSQAVFGSTEQTNKFVQTAGLFNITTKKSIDILGTGIGQFASRMHLDAGIMLDTMNNMGNALLGTNASIGTTTQSLTRFVDGMHKVGGMTIYQQNEMLKGIENLSKGVDTFTYMAASGKGDLEKYYATAVGQTPIEKAKTIIDRFTKEGMTTTGIAIATKQMGIFSGMEEGMRLQTVEAFKKMGAAASMKNMSQDEVMRNILGVKPGQEDMWTKIASAELVGHDIQGQMLETLLKLLQTVTTGIMGMFGAFGKTQAAQKFQQLNIDKQMSVTSGGGQYTNSNWGMATAK